MKTKLVEHNQTIETSATYGTDQPFQERTIHVRFLATRWVVDPPRANKIANKSLMARVNDAIMAYCATIAGVRFPPPPLTPLNSGVYGPRDGSSPRSPTK